MIRNRAFQFIDTIGGHSSVGGVLSAMEKALSYLGFRYFCFHTLPALKQSFSEVVLANKLPVDWMNHYVAHGCAEHDPSQRHVKRVVHAYEWQDAPFDREREPRAAEFVQRAHDFGVANGFVVPIPGPAGNIGSVWMGGTDKPVHVRYKPALHLMSLYAFAHVQRLNGTVQEDQKISHREREILTWIAAGKSTVEIGEMLSISNRTVEWHVQRLVAKLGARTRTNAVAIALRDSLIAV
jgi:DNA-binding CsgD family transcriptional regulator